MNDDRDLYSGMIRLHILHHADKEVIFGAGMAEELARHGYKISPGTMYPILHGLEKRGYLHSSEERAGKSVRRRLWNYTFRAPCPQEGETACERTLWRAD